MADRHEFEFSHRTRAERSVQARRKIADGKSDRDAAVGVGILWGLVCLAFAALIVWIAPEGKIAPVYQFILLVVVPVVMGFIAWLTTHFSGYTKIDEGRKEEWAEDGGSSDEYLRR